MTDQERSQETRHDGESGTKDDPETSDMKDPRPGSDDIGEAQMPSDYHEAVARRPVEVRLPETPDLSEDGERSDAEDGTGGDDQEPDRESDQDTDPEPDRDTDQDTDQDTEDSHDESGPDDQRA
jgi:hypothetical protein